MRGERGGGARTMLLVVGVDMSIRERAFWWQVAPPAVLPPVAPFF